MRKTSIILISILIMVGCTTVSQIATLKKCEFRVQGIKEVVAAGVNVSGKKSISDVSILDAGKITLAIKRGSLPVTMTCAVEIRNPNSQTAIVNRVEYKVYLDGNELFSGFTTDSIKVPGGNHVAVIPLKVTFDLFTVMQGKTQDAILNLLFNLAGASDVPSTLTVQLKPSISIGKATIPYPGFIEITREFGGK
jgi:hypothetical protein